MPTRPQVTRPRSRTGLSERGALAGFGGHGERGARAYNGGLGAESPAGVQGQSPLKLNPFSILRVQRKPQICPIRSTETRKV